MKTPKKVLVITAAGIVAVIIGCVTFMLMIHFSTFLPNAPMETLTKEIDSGDFYNYSVRWGSELPEEYRSGIDGIKNNELVLVENDFSEHQGVRGRRILKEYGRSWPWSQSSEFWQTLKRSRITLPQVIVKSQSWQANRPTLLPSTGYYRTSGGYWTIQLHGEDFRVPDITFWDFIPLEAL